MVCNKQLSTGEELYVIDENKFVCKDDYLSSSSLKEGSLNSGRRPPLLHGPRPQRPGAMRGLAALYFAPCGSPVPNPAPAHSQGSSRARKGPGVWGRDTAFFRSQSYRTPERSVLLQFKNLFQSCHLPRFWNCASLLSASLELPEVSTCTGRTLSGSRRKERREKKIRGPESTCTPSLAGPLSKNTGHSRGRASPSPGNSRKVPRRLD